jgi:hypothetical protein
LTDKYRVCPNRRGVYLPNESVPAQEGLTAVRAGEIKQSVAAGALVRNLPWQST